ncbi:MAG: sulfonate transport system substrate-binding protein [Alphaproteobacteria bacterium]|nr:sulfonate transport system substrate-binding protein [Alphaproteobacteria bacterium]
MTKRSAPGCISRAMRRLAQDSLRLGLTAVLLVAASAARAQDTAQQTLRVGHFPNITHVQALVARGLAREGKDWFAERLGPKVKIEWYAYNAGPSAMEAIFADSIDMTYVGPSPALNAYVRSRGAEIRVVAGAVDNGSALVVQGDSQLKQPSDFRGKRVATPQLGNTQDVTARAWFVAGGLRVTQTGGDVQIVPTANPDQLTLFLRKALDAVWTVEPWVSRLELEAGGKVLVEETDAVTTVLVARVKFLAEKRELARRFVAAHRELTDWIRQNPAEAQRLLRDEMRAAFRSNLPPELVARAWARTTITTEVSLKVFQTYVTNAQKAGFLRDVPDLSRLIETP